MQIEVSVQDWVHGKHFEQGLLQDEGSTIGSETIGSDLWEKWFFKWIALA